MYVVISVSAAAVVFRLPPACWLASGWMWLLAGLAALVLVLLPGIGKEVNGAQRWLPLGPFTLQPSEFAKFTVVIYLAGYLVRQAQEVRNQVFGFLKPMGVLGLVTVLLMAEPDFGATVIVVATAFGMLFLAGVKLSHFLSVLALSLVGLVGLIFAAPYRVQRLTAYTDPWADPYGSGFQLIQSLIAFGRGEWLGVGLGNSVQKLFYLPEAHTDFVFSIWAEETGFVGALLVIGLFTALIARILWVARRAQSVDEDFGAYLCYGVALVFSGQAFVNMGVSSGLLPTKGLTLPFVSYGGTSLIVCCCMLALVLRIERELPAAAARKPSAAGVEA
jgi:cell division protein FtsW